MRLRISSTTRPRDLRFTFRQLPTLHECKRPRNRHRRQLGDGRRLSPEPPDSPASAAGRGTRSTRSATCTPSTIRDSPRWTFVETFLEMPESRESCAAFKQTFCAFFGKSSNGVVKIDLQTFGRLPPTCASMDGCRCARTQTAVQQRLRWIDDHLHRIEGPLAAQTVACFARAVWAVERKRARLQLRNARAAVRSRPASANRVALRRSPLR